MKSITLTQGKTSTLDDGDFDYLNQWKWQAVKNKNRWSASRSEGKNKHIYMHREIMNAPNGVEVDHINGDGLDNRRENLRLCTHTENNRNRRIPSNNTTGYKGVCPNVPGCKARYRAQIKTGGKQVFLGSFYTPEEAARAYDVKAREIFGEFAQLNFPEV